MEYSSNIMEIRKFQDLDNCRLKCKERIPQSLRIQVFNAYWSLGTSHRMIEYLTKCIEVCPKLTSKLSAKKKRSCSFRYYIHGFDQIIHLVCKGCFLKIFGESHRNLQKICEKLRENLPQHNTKSPEDENVNNLEVKVKEEDDNDVLFVAPVDPAVQPTSKMTQVKRENMKWPEDEDVNYLEVIIKEEDDDDVSFVAAVDPPAQPTTSQGNNNDVMYCMKQLESLPIVYTTRLDDMNISRFHTIDPSLFFEKIIHKSRPTLTTDSFKNQTRCIARPKSFRQLRQTINNVNIRVRRELGGKKRKRNREHQGPFEPVGGYFKDTHNLCVKPISESPVENITEQNTISVEENAKFDLYSYSYRCNYFVIRNTKRNEADVYYFNENGAVTQHFISAKQGNLYTPTIKNAEVPYCCWYQREEFVSLMGRFLPLPTLKYLRKPHPCAMSQCTCCCKQKVDSQDKTKKFSDNSHTSAHSKARGITELTAERMVAPKKINVLIDDMLNSSPTGPPSTTLISKAFAYRPQIAQALGLGSTGLGIDLNQNSNLDYKTVNIFMDYKNGGNEYYQIGSDGEVREHLKNVSASFIQEGAASYENCEYETICCWQKREYFLNKLKGMNMLPKSKYLKRPHNCPTDKCICCCKPWKKAKIMNNLKEINLPDIPNYSNDPENKIPPLKFVFANIEPVIPDHAIAELEKLLPSSSNVQTIIDLSTEKENDLALLDSSYKLICENAKYLLESKLNKFKKTYISVNDKKKVTATLDYPVTKLTTNELKILNDILTQAQRSVDALKKPSANFNSNIILNNTAISNHSEAGVEGNNLRIAISQSKIPSVKQTRSKMYALMSEWSEVQDDTYCKAVELFFRMQTLHKASMMMSKMHKDFGQIDSITELPKKQNARKLKGNNKAKMLDIAVADVEADSFDFSNDETEDPLAFSNDNSLNHTIQLIRQTDLTASYVKNPLNAKTEDITTAIPVTIITKNAIKLPKHLGRVRLQVPSNPTPIVLNSTEVDLEEEIPVTSIIGLDVEKEPQILTENNDCILGP